MARQLDLSDGPLTPARIHSAIDLVDTELTEVVATSTAYHYPRATNFSGQGHLGAGWNTEIDRLHLRIENAAVNTGRPVPMPNFRIHEHATGNHDSKRLHEDLDRLHARIERLKHTAPVQQTVTKSTDNTGTGIWPGNQFGSLANTANGTYELFLELQSGGQTQYRFGFKNVFTNWYFGWPSSQEITAGDLTFVTDAEAPPGMVGTFQDTVEVS